jgi:2,3-bisphosphoglycerate-dependent phosphoglycerate mutase
MTTFGFIRHGITDWNKEKRAQGQIDIPLNAEGLRQAEMLADRLQNKQWDRIVASNLTRAQQTATVISACLVLDVNTDVRLRERNFGEMEGTTEAERVALWGPDWRNRDMGMEPKDEVITRGMSLINDLTRQFPDNHILLVSHIAFIQIMLQKLLPALDNIEHLENTSLTVVEQLDNRWTCKLYNCSDHLQIMMTDGAAPI